MIASVHEEGPAAPGQKAQTQERILRVSMELFAQRGYHRTSMSMIASRAGLSRSAIFWHFGDKETLFRETCRHFLIPFRLSIDTPASSEDPRAAILQQLRSHAQFIEANKELIHAFLGWVFSSPDQARWLREELLGLHGIFERRLEQAFGALLGRPDDARFAAASLLSLLHGNMVLALVDAPGSGAGARAALAERMVETVLAGPPEQGRAAPARGRTRGTRAPGG